MFVKIIKITTKIINSPGQSKIQYYNCIRGIRNRSSCLGSFGFQSSNSKFILSLTETPSVAGTKYWKGNNTQTNL